uniref:DUF6199 family natural product biosynthesis protein n=1 Tax=Paenibacillus sp. FSL H8-0282 TaxID=2954741 RepID=UPI00403F29D5
MGFFIFLFVLLALLNIFFPHLGWYMRYGWMMKGDVEPNHAYLLMTRISSIVALIILFFIWTSF